MSADGDLLRVDLQELKALLSKFHAIEDDLATLRNKLTDELSTTVELGQYGGEIFSVFIGLPDMRLTTSGDDWLRKRHREKSRSMYGALGSGIHAVDELSSASSGAYHAIIELIKDLEMQLRAVIENLSASISKYEDTEVYVSDTMRRAHPM